MFSQIVPEYDEDDMMDIHIDRVGDVTVVQMAGRFDINSATSVQEAVQSEATQGSKILLDMSEVTYMSSAGLRILLMLYRTISDHVGHIVLAGMSEELLDVMSITGFLDFFDIVESREAGIATLNRIKQ